MAKEIKHCWAHGYQILANCGRPRLFWYLVHSNRPKGRTAFQSLFAIHATMFELLTQWVKLLRFLSATLLSSSAGFK